MQIVANIEAVEGFGVIPPHLQHSMCGILKFTNPKSPHLYSPDSSFSLPFMITIFDAESDLLARKGKLSPVTARLFIDPELQHIDLSSCAGMNSPSHHSLHLFVAIPISVIRLVMYRLPTAKTRTQFFPHRFGQRDVHPDRAVRESGVVKAIRMRSIQRRLSGGKIPRSLRSSTLLHSHHSSSSALLPPAAFSTFSTADCI